MAPASTGRERRSKIAVIKTDQTNNGIRCRLMPGHRIFKIVVIKFTAPIIDDAPAKCRLKIARSTDGPECACTEERGGYTVQPVPAPLSTKEDATKSSNAGGKSQNEILFIRGKLISGAPIIKGTNQLP